MVQSSRYYFRNYSFKRWQVSSRAISVLVLLENAIDIWVALLNFYHLHFNLAFQPSLNHLVDCLAVELRLWIMKKNLIVPIFFDSEKLRHFLKEQRPISHLYEMLCSTLNINDQSIRQNIELKRLKGYVMRLINLKNSQEYSLENDRI